MDGRQAQRPTATNSLRLTVPRDGAKGTSIPVDADSGREKPARPVAVYAAIRTFNLATEAAVHCDPPGEG
jgi:hypothetical protein